MENHSQTDIRKQESEKELEALLLSLCRIRSLSGYESSPEICRTLEELSSYCGGFDEVHHTPSGNHIFIRRCGIPGAKALMLDAHFDEIGMMVEQIRDDGSLTIGCLGGIDRRTLTAARLVLLTDAGEIPAVVCARPVTTVGVNSKTVDDPKQLRVFTGYSKKQLQEMGVTVGTLVGFSGEESRLSSGFLTFRGFDNKAGVATVLEAARRMAESRPAVDLYILLSSGEESHTVGAKTGTVQLRPDEAIVVDTDFARTPDVDGKKSIEIGKGPSITLSVQVDRKMTARLCKLGEEKNIPCQPICWPDSTGTNATVIPFLAGGVRTAVVSIPIKYMHTYAETLLMQDLTAAAALLEAYAIDRFGRKEE